MLPPQPLLSLSVSSAPTTALPVPASISQAGASVAERIAAHRSPKTTKLYDRTADPITLNEIEKIGM